MISWTRFRYLSGPMSGYRTGIHQLADRKILVTRTFKLIQPQPGSWNIIGTLLEAMFGSVQVDFLLAALKLAYESLAAGKRIPGHALIFAGPPNCGKSFIQNHVLTPILGGRACRCYRYLKGGTEFNGDFFEAEHLIIDDDIPSNTYQSRKTLAASIKSIVASEVHSCHYKGRDAFSVMPFWRLSISVNNDPDSLQVLPAMADSLIEKLMLFKVNSCEMPMPTYTIDERAAFRAAVQQELPALIHDLLQWNVPEEIVHPRFGLKFFHHHELVEALKEISWEARFMAIIDGVLFTSQNPVISAEGFQPWIGTGNELERKIMSSNYRDEAKRILTNQTYGTHLGRLAHSYPGRIYKERTANQRGWMIMPPTEPSNQTPSVPVELTGI